jgi:hypothetical protein
VALSQAQNIIGENQILATLPSRCPQGGSNDCWENLDSSDKKVTVGQYLKVCKSSDDGKTGAWEDRQKAIKNLLIGDSIERKDYSKGYFKLSQYTYYPTKNLGTITVEGRVKNQSDSGDQTPPTRYEADIPVGDPSRPADDNVPGLWIQNGDTTNSTNQETGNNKNAVAATVWLSDCTIGESNRSTIENNVKNINSKATANPIVKFSPLNFPALLQTVSKLKSVLQSATVNESTDNQFVNVTSWGESEDKATGILAGANTKNITVVGQSLTSPTEDTTTPSPQPTNVVICSPSDSANTFPRKGDVPQAVDINRDGNKVFIYEYVVTSIGATSKLTVNTVPGCRVRFHLLGEIGNKSEILHSCDTTTGCKSTDLQIFAYGENKNLCIAGDKLFEAFIFAPFSNVGLTSTASTGGVKGAVWAKTWGKNCSFTSTSTPVVNQSVLWSELGKDLIPQGMPPQLGRISSWRQCIIKPDNVKSQVTDLTKYCKDDS